MKNRFPVLPLPSICSLGACFRLKLRLKQATVILAALFLASCTVGHIPSTVNGVDPNLGLTVLPDALSFGNVNVGVRKTQAVTLINAGNVPITISSGQVTGSGFTLSGGSFPLTLNGKETAQFSIAFTPSSAGSMTGELVLWSNAHNTSQSVSLKGMGVGPSSHHGPHQGGGSSGNGSGSGSNSPPPSSGGSGTSSESHAVSLAWQSSNSYVVGYNVYRSGTSGGPYSKLNTELVTCTCYTDSVDQSGTFYYVVTSVDSAGEESANSNETQVNIP